MKYPPSPDKGMNTCAECINIAPPGEYLCEECVKDSEGSPEIVKMEKTQKEEKKEEKFTCEKHRCEKCNGCANDGCLQLVFMVIIAWVVVKLSEHALAAKILDF